MQQVAKKSAPSGALMFWAIVLSAAAIGFAAARWWTAAEPGASRIDAYQRCVALVDRGAQWDESETGWRCKVVPGEAR